MRAICFAGAVAATLITALPASATVTIQNDPGGMLIKYIERFDALRQSGEYVRIDGRCASACTMALGIIPHDHLCVTKRAKFGFHQAYDIVTDKTSVFGTQIMLSFYPAKVKNWIKRHGGLTRKIKIMPGKESGVQACK